MCDRSDVRRLAEATHRGLALLRQAAVLCILGATLSASAQPPPNPWPRNAQAPVRPVQEPVSFVQVPVSLDLTPLFAAAEELLPLRAGHWPQWRDWHGIDTRYRAWRGPLQFSMYGETLQAMAHVRYQLQARKQLFAGLAPKVGCGVDEPPRQALVGLLVRLDWRPDWVLTPKFRVLPTRFLDGCEVSVAQIDVSPVVGRVFEERMEKSLREAIADLRPRLDRLRLDAARAWAGMQSPREILPGLWLHAQPLAVALAPLRGEGDRVHSALWLALRPRLSVSAEAASAPVPLPPLRPYRPMRPGLNLALSLDLDYRAVSAALSRRLAGQPLDLGGHLDGRRAVVDSVMLGPRDGSLVVTAELAGELGGRLEIVARPGFDAAGQAIVVNDLSFVFDADDLDLEVLARIFYDRIRDHIAEAANEALAEQMEAARLALATNLSGALPSSLQPDVSGLRIESLKITVGEGALRLGGSVSGNLVLDAAGN